LSFNIKTFNEILGISRVQASHTEKIVSAIGGLLAILAILGISQRSLGSHGAVVIVASMGASAVLIFAVPHGQLSQPWPVFGGHIISAVIGVTCAKLFVNEIMAAGLAVGFAITAMYYLHCIHPPGGATALSAVLGGSAVNELGYQFVVAPVVLNVLVLILAGVLYNALFHWRRYPTFFHGKETTGATSRVDSMPNISHEDFVYALSEIDSFIDISEHDLVRVYDLAMNKSQDFSACTFKLAVGEYYSNGKYGNDWAVRQIVDKSEDRDNAEETIIYKVVAGNGRRTSGYSSKADFLRWARHQVTRDEENWKRVDNNS